MYVLVRFRMHGLSICDLYFTIEDYDGVGINYMQSINKNVCAKVDVHNITSFVCLNIKNN